MRLDFRVLWVDDQPKHIESFAESIQRYLSDQGFGLEIIRAHSVEEASEKVAEHVHSDGIDLVMVDYDLGKGDGGEKALQVVARKMPFKEVVFYSATDANKLRSIAFGLGIDGVYFTTRMDLVSDVRSVISKTLGRVLDIDHMRGIVMSATSDIDYLIERSIYARFFQMKEDERVAFLNQTYDIIERKFKKWSKDLEKVKSEMSIDSLLALRHIFTAADKLGVLTKVLESISHDGTNTYIDYLKEYRNEIVPRRNKLAHVMLSRDEDGNLILSGSESITADDMKQLRCDLIKHRDNVENVAVILDVET